MSYTITCDDVVLYDTSTLDLIVQNPKASFKANGSGSLSFNVLPSHPYYNLINKITSIITLKKEDDTIFKGRVLTDSIDIDNIKTVSCEGELAYFNDTTVAPQYITGTPLQMLTYLINNHNTQVTTFIGKNAPQYNTFTLGNVTVSGSSTIQVESYMSTWEFISSKLLKEFDGRLYIRYEGDIRYLDFLTGYANENSQGIELGYNIVDINREVDGSNICTAIVPLGKDNLTVASVNGGSAIIKDDTLVSKYGLIIKTESNTGISNASTLYSYGVSKLNAYSVLKTSIDMSALDMNLIDDNIERFKIGDRVHVVSLAHDLDTYLTVSEITLDLANPKNNKIKLESEE